MMDISYENIVVEELLQKGANTIVYSSHHSTCSHNHPEQAITPAVMNSTMELKLLHPGYSSNI
ncbi:hypothetical protein NKR74_05655 [Bacillus sp. 3103sda1]|uniref:hypothetical protein n=1 Tax=Bacillus sp. 3103sda1 TaxID=2953808 RepID=UPI00209E2AEF|nr:hypothetical protein [Bacillus sp. 3103sda1]MCP1122823.1 hypothetical protein [Bacillus sp. 3103sda1]